MQLKSFKAVSAKYYSAVINAPSQPSQFLRHHSALAELIYLNSALPNIISIVIMHASLLFAVQCQLNR